MLVFNTLYGKQFMQEQDWPKIELITNAEHHFNNLCLKIRALASTWLLACFGGVGFLLSKSLNLELPINYLIILLCWAGSFGILILWILDLLIYQRMLNAWFSERENIELNNTDYPQIWKKITLSQPGGRATNLIKIYYLALVALPLALAMYVSLYMKLNLAWASSTATLGVALLLMIHFLSPSDK